MEDLAQEIADELRKEKAKNYAAAEVPLEPSEDIVITQQSAPPVVESSSPVGGKKSGGLSSIKGLGALSSSILGKNKSSKMMVREDPTPPEPVVAPVRSTSRTTRGVLSKRANEYPVPDPDPNKFSDFGS